MLDALTLDQMRIFVAIADTGSFRAAATRLSRVQSAVSHAVANLEAELGVSLFDRSGHRPVLTPAGQSLLSDARAILLKTDTMRARARGLGTGVELGLTIALDPQFPPGLAGAALEEMHRTIPRSPYGYSRHLSEKQFMRYGSAAARWPSVVSIFPIHILNGGRSRLCRAPPSSLLATRSLSWLQREIRSQRRIWRTMCRSLRRIHLRLHKAATLTFCLLEHGG